MKLLAFIFALFISILGFILFLIFPFSYLIFGFTIGAILGSESSSSTIGCALGGMLLGPFAIVLAPIMIGSKKCKKCLQMIDSRATVCKHCHSDLTQ